MAIAEIELPDGRVVELEVPDGTSEQQIMAWIQANPQELEKAPTAKPQDTGMGMSELLGQTTRSLKTAIPGPLGDFVAGVSSGYASIPEGIRQAYNKVTGDEEELARLNAEYEQRKAKLRELTGDSTTAAAGDVVGQIAPFLMGGAVVGAPKAAGVLPGTARAMVGGAAGGAAGGYTTALTPEQEAAGERESNAALGGVVGGTLPALINPISRGVQWAKDVSGRMLPKDALEDALTKMTGVTNSTSVQDVVDSLRGKVKGRTDELQARFSKLYEAEKNLNLPPVRLDETARHDPNRLISEALTGYDTGKGGRAARTIAQASKYDPSTGAVMGPEREFWDARKLISHLKRQSEAYRGGANSAQSQVLDNIVRNMESDLDRWASQDVDAARAWLKAKKLDASYAKRMVPLIDASEGRPIGKWRDKAYNEEALNQLFMGQRKGTELRELSKRVPGADEDLKKYLAIQLRNMDGREPARLGLSSSQEALFSKPEQRYLRGLKQALEEQAGDTGVMHSAAQIAGKVIGDFPEKARHGVRAYGDKVPEKFDLGSLATALRAAGLFRYNSEE